MLKKRPTVDDRAVLIDLVRFFEREKFIDSFVEILR
jgi:hypothetical protein